MSTFIHFFPMLVVTDGDLIKEFTLSQFIGIQSQAQGLSNYPVSFSFFSCLA